MDFVVVGCGLGALGVLLGLTLRDAGSWWGRVRRREPPSSGEVARRVAWGRACRAGGRILALGGGGICLATLLALVARLDDRAGAAVVMATVVLATGGALAWAVAYARRYHPRPVRVRGILRPVPRVIAAEPPPLAVAIEAAIAHSGVPPADLSPITELADGPSADAPLTAPVDPDADDGPAVREAELPPAPAMAPNGTGPADAADDGIAATVPAIEGMAVSEVSDPLPAGDEASAEAVPRAEEATEQPAPETERPVAGALTSAGRAS